MARHGGRP